MTFFILFLLAQAEISVYHYYSKKIKPDPNKIFEKRIIFELEGFESIFGKFSKRFKNYHISGSFFSLDKFNEFKINSLFLRRFFSDSVFYVSSVFKSEEKDYYSVNYFKLSPSFSYKRFWVFTNFEGFLSYKADIPNDFHKKFYFETYFDFVKSGTGIFYKVDEDRIIPYLYFSPDFNNVFFPSFYFYFNESNKSKFYKFNFYSVIKNVRISFTYSNKIAYYTPYKEFYFLLFNFPFLFELEDLEEIYGSFYNFSLSLFSGPLLMKFSYSRFESDSFYIYYFSDSKFELKREKLFEKIFLVFQIFDKFSFYFIHTTPLSIYFLLNLKIPLKNFYFEFNTQSIFDRNILVFEPKIGYIYKGYVFFISSVLLNKEVYPLKKEVRVGIKKRF